jgi:hypothetical protein
VQVCQNVRPYRACFEASIWYTSQRSKSPQQYQPASTNMRIVISNYTLRATSLSSLSTLESNACSMLCHAMPCTCFAFALRRSKSVSAIMGPFLMLVQAHATAPKIDRAAHSCQHCIHHQPQSRHKCIISASSPAGSNLRMDILRMAVRSAKELKARNLHFFSQAREVGGRDTQHHAAMRSNSINNRARVNKHPDQVSRIGPASTELSRAAI